MPLTNQLWSVSLTSLGNLDRCEADLSPWCYNPLLFDTIEILGNTLGTSRVI